ncbi:MAG: hypothetical protein U1A78_24145 [Polyangia bacterium]
MEQRFSALGGRGSQARVVLLEPGTPGFLGLELRASPALRGGRLVLRTDQGVLGTVEVSGHGRDDKAVGEVVGPSVVVVLPVPAATRLLDIVREDSGAPLLVAARLRRSLAGLRHVEPRLAERDRDADKLEQLRQATRALRAARDQDARARARLHRADTLLGLDAPMLARNDLDHAMPSLADDESLAQARALMASTLTPPLLPRPAQGPAAVLLAAGAGLTGAQAEVACASAALVRFAGDALAGRSAAASCAGALGQYVAARLEEQGGTPDRAAQHYSAAYLQSLDAGQPRPALAREGALRFAERGAGPGSQHGLALAAASAQDNDLLAGRAMARLQGLSHLSLVRGVDAGIDARIKEKEPTVVPLSLRAALMDVPWPAGQFMELRAGKSAETTLQVSRPVKVRMEALCDDGGEVPSIGSPCTVRIEADGAPAGDGARVLRAGERGRLGEVPFGSGPHRIKVTLERRDPAARAFVHLSTSRPLAGDSGRAEGEGYYSMAIAGPPVLRFTATADEPVKLRAQGSTVLRIDTLAAAGSGARALAVELSLAGQAAVRRVYPVCTQTPGSPLGPPPGSQIDPSLELKLLPDAAAYDCRSLLMVPLIRAGTYQITLRPVGSRAMALAMSVYEDEPAVQPFEAGDQALASQLPDKPITEPQSPVLATLSRPMSDAVRAIGALQVQQLGVFGSTGRKNPQVGDTYGETSIFYRRRLDSAPVWFRAGTALRLRSGSPSFGVEGLAFGRIPVVQLRLLANLQSYTQSVEGKQEYSVALHSYVERSFALIPHLFLLPRFAFTATYQSLAARPPLPRSTDGSDAPAPTPIDLSVFNVYDAAHPTGIYGQLIVWGVPFINLITYGSVRLTSNRDVHQLDSVSGRFGVDLALRTTEIVADYEIAQYLVDDARTKQLLQHRLSAALKQTIWLHRNHRLGLVGSGYFEASSQASVVTVGAFWEGSPGRGLDDYSTPEINLPQQLSQGRNALRPEETLR